MFPPLRQTPPNLPAGGRAALNFLTVHCGLLICALFLLAGLVLAGDYGIHYDEQTQIRIATANLNAILGHSEGLETLNYIDRLYGVAFELPLLLAHRALGLDALVVNDYHSIHRLRLTLTHLFFIIGGYFCYRLAYQLFNNRLIALFALLCYLLHPRIYAHSFFNSKDPVFLSMFSIALYLLERACRKDTVAAFLLLGVAVGLLINLRIMGIMLLAAPLAMRGWDWFYDETGPERKRVLLTGGLFALAAGLTLYAVTPYAWTHPVDYLISNLNQTVNHPVTVPQLFQGKRIIADGVPPHYAATWFVITAPPLLLLLGGLGIAAAGAPGLARPGTVFRSNRRRFALLLLACFLLPPLAAALLSSNQYEGWRHFYFLYVPFCLLAAGGLHWLAGALARQGRWRAGVYGLAGLGVGLTLLQLIQLHPMQHIYFNFLVDRATPERLRTQYEIDRWRAVRRAAAEHLLQSHPGEVLELRSDEWERKILPPADRQRLRVAAGGRRADYELTRPDPSRPDLAFNSRYGRFYNNTLVALRPMDAARMTPAAIAAYQELYHQAIAGEPIIRADYKVYRNGSRLTFIQENCPPDSPEAWFGVTPFPPYREIRPPEPSYYTAPSLSNHRVQLGDLCLAVIQLPDYLRGDIIIAQRRLGQLWPIGAPLWTELYSLDPPGLRERLDQLRLAQGPAGVGTFEVFLEQDTGGGYRLLYAKADCSRAEYETGVFLHIHPYNPGNLPFYLWQNGMENREFQLARYGARPGGECLAVFPLPDYPIARLLTGQDELWERNIYPPADPERLRAAYAALSDIQPAARAYFDLYWRDNQLIYRRETCAAADTAAGFFLHITPAEVADLPAERQAAGFANLDFAFDRRGGSFDGKCLATAPLPNYPVKYIRTGQYIAGQGELWAAELKVGR